MQRHYCNPRKSPPEPPRGTPSTSITPQQSPACPYPATPTSSTSLTHPAPSNAPPRSVAPPCASPGTRTASTWNTTWGHHLWGVLPRRTAHHGRRRHRHTATHDDPAPQHLGSRGRHGGHPPHQAPCGPAPPQSTRVRPHHTSVGTMDGVQGHAPPGRPTHRQAGVTPLRIRQWTRRHAGQTPEHQPHPRARTRATGHPTPQPPAAPAPDTPGHTAPLNGCPRTRRTRIETSNTTTQHPSSNWPPHWATQRTPNSYDASKTPSTPPSTTPPCALIASQHTYKSPDSNSPSNNFPSSPDTTDGIRAARSTSPQDTPNASAATQKKKHGTTSRRAPCTEDWTPSQTGTGPTPSHSTPDG